MKMTAKAVIAAALVSVGLGGCAQQPVKSAAACPENAPLGQTDVPLAAPHTKNFKVVDQ